MPVAADLLFNICDARDGVKLIYPRRLQLRG